jgi:hypothetical protein
MGGVGLTTPTIERFLAAVRSEQDFTFASGFQFRGNSPSSRSDPQHPPTQTALDSHRYATDSTLVASSATRADTVEDAISTTSPATRRDL